MADRQRTASTLEMIGGRLCLDFANTVNTRVERLRKEYLLDYDALIAWGRHAGVISENHERTLLQGAARHPDLAASALDRALALREAIFRLFSGIARKMEPDKKDLHL
jgi:predicted RNA-binding Zn ribbon-like protein